jgi:A1 cistron-splicing factor AAR2
MSTRIGAFACLARGDVLVRRWSPEAEALLPLADADDAERLARATRGFEFDAHLGAYPLDTWPRWAALMQCVTPAVIERLEPVQKFVFSSALSEAASKVSATPHSVQRNPQASATATAARDEDAAQSSPAAAAASSSAAAATAAPNQSSTQQPESQKPLSVRLYAALGTGNMFFSDVAIAPDAAMQRGLTPAQVTALHLDKSPLLLRLLGRLMPDAHGAAMSLMAELQVAFVAFMVGQSLVAFEQWKKIVVLLTSCGAALESHPTLFVAFARTLASQLDEVPTDFFEDELSAHSFLRRALKVCRVSWC